MSGDWVIVTDEWVTVERLRELINEGRDTHTWGPWPVEMSVPVTIPAGAIVTTAVYTGDGRLVLKWHKPVADLFGEEP